MQQSDTRYLDVKDVISNDVTYTQNNNNEVLPSQIKIKTSSHSSVCF